MGETCSDDVLQRAIEKSLNNMEDNCQNEEQSKESNNDDDNGLTTKKKRTRNRAPKERKEKYKNDLRSKATKQLQKIKKIYDKLPKKKKNPKFEEDLEYWGDCLTTSNEWPNKDKENNICIFGQNVNGLSYYNEYIDWEMALNYMDKF